MDAIIGIIVLGVVGYIYFVPTVIAYQRDHPNASPILIVNLFLGWTLIGWVVSLAWALTQNATLGRLNK